MNKKTVLKNIDNIYNKLNNGYILLSGYKSNQNPYLYHRITADKNYIYYRNFGQYASKNTKNALKGYKNIIYSNCYYKYAPQIKYHTLILLDKCIKAVQNG
jgi:hypothetical protein